MEATSDTTCSKWQVGLGGQSRVSYLAMYLTIHPVRLRPLSGEREPDPLPAG